MGKAIGDALGAASEFLAEREVSATFGILRDYRAREWFAPGEFTDDTSMALWMAEAIIKGDGVEANAVGDAWVEWMETDGRGIGCQTLKALTLIQHGMAPLDAGRRVWQDSGRRAAGNGAVMRCTPIGLLRFRDQERLVAESILTSQITHYDPRCTWGCVAVNTAIAAILRREPDPRERAMEAVRGRNPELEEGLAAAAQEPIADMRLDGRNQGYTVLTTNVAFAALEQYDDFEDAIVAIINKGGDADTNAAVAGALLGARYGTAELPPEWVDGLVGRERVVRAAEGLMEMATG